jgi:hypothetical protein
MLITEMSALKITARTRLASFDVKKKGHDLPPRMQERPAWPRKQRGEPDLLLLVVLHTPDKSPRTTQARIFSETGQQAWILQSQIQHETGQQG